MQRTTEDSNVLIDIIACLIQEDKLAQALAIFPSLSYYFASSINPCFHSWPAAVIGVHGFLGGRRRFRIWGGVGQEKLSSLSGESRQCRPEEPNRVLELGFCIHRTLEETQDEGRTKFETGQPYWF